MSTSGATRGLSATVAANLKRGRLAKGMTQGQLAVALGLSDAMAVSRWERGVHRPDGENQVRLAELLFDGDLSALYLEEAAA